MNALTEDENRTLENVESLLKEIYQFDFHNINRFALETFDELKNKIDGLWDIFAAGGLVNPLEVIEQITYLMFIHDLDDSDNMRARESAMLGLPFQSIFSGEVKIGERTIDGSQLKWSVFHDFPADRMYMIMQEWVFPFIKNLHNDNSKAFLQYQQLQNLYHTYIPYD